MKVGIMDADLLYRPRNSFPNLACMKLAGYHKSRGDDTELVLDLENLGAYGSLYMATAKVHKSTDTKSIVKSVTVPTSAKIIFLSPVRASLITISPAKKSVPSRNGSGRGRR